MLSDLSGFAVRFPQASLGGIHYFAGDLGDREPARQIKVTGGGLQGGAAPCISQDVSIFDSNCRGEVAVSSSVARWR